ncbi:hypothetical protein ACFLXY_00505 [Chloroflexota bacterium]
MRYVKIKVVSIVLSAIMLLTCVSCGDETVSSDTPLDDTPDVKSDSDNFYEEMADLAKKYKDDPEKFDQAVYAQQYGIDMDEAAWRFDIMNNAHLLGNALENDHPDVFTGFWIEHDPEFRLVASFTRNGEEILETYREKYPDLVEITVIKENKYTLDELLQAQEEVNQILEELGLFCSSATMEMDNRVEIYVTDSELFYSTLEEAGVELPDCVVPVIVYEPLRGVPDGLNPDPSVNFPQFKTHSGSVMTALLTGKLELVEGYLRVGDSIIIWQPDYFVHNNDGKIEIWDRDGKVVGRVGEEIVMGGGGGGTLEWINPMLKESLPQNIEGPFWLQDGGTRLNLNFNSEFFSLEVITSEKDTVYFLKRKPLIDETARQEIVLTGSLVASYAEGVIVNPHIRTEAKPEENKGSVQYTTFWPTSYSARIRDGFFEILDDSGSVVLKDGEKVDISGRIIHSYIKQLNEELPGQCFGPYLIVESCKKIES